MKLRTLRTAAAVTGAVAAVSFGTTSALAVPPPNSAVSILDECAPESMYERTACFWAMWRWRAIARWSVANCRVIWAIT